MALADNAFPLMQRVRQQLHRAPLEPGRIPDAVHQGFQRASVAGRLRVGMRVAIGAGSRGISRYAEVVKATVDAVKALGCEPFIFPAMGSHGGATGPGQAELLAGWGITPQAMGCAIRSAMTVVELGRTAKGVPVYLDQYADRKSVV